MTNLVALHNNVNKIRAKKVSDNVKLQELKVLFASTDNSELLNFMLRATDENVTNVFVSSLFNVICEFVEICWNIGYARDL